MPTWRPVTYSDEALGQVSVPAGPVRLIRGCGSGLTRRPGDPPGRFWAVGDRGPNVSVDAAVERWGCADLRDLPVEDGAKVMPRPDVGPALGELQLEGDVVRLLRVTPLRAADGRPISGLPPPGGPHAASEPALDLEGRRLPPDPSGADTEGVAALADGSFWIGDEYGPSLLRVDADGRVRTRLVPAGTEALFKGAQYQVAADLPALAARRRLNRGFEALALSADGGRLHLAFQSPLAHPDEAAHEHGRHVRVWTLDGESGALLAQYAYRFDPPDSFRRDAERGSVSRADLKVSEMITVGNGGLLILERGSATTKLYLTRLDQALALGREHDDPETRPTLEALSGREEPVRSFPELAKTLLVSTDDHPEVSVDLEGMVQLSPRELLLVNDNDFGVEGVETRFWLLTLDADLG